MGKTPKKPKGQLPSKNVRVQVYLGTDDNGKRRYKSFTAPTRKKALEMANVWKATHKGKERPISAENITVKEAARRYIDVKYSALSPATVSGYEKNLKNHLSEGFGDKKITELTSADVQLWISSLRNKRTGKPLSPKTVRNVYSQFESAVEMFAPDIMIKITLPAKKKPNLYCPNDQNVKKLLDYIKGTELEVAVLLAAFGPMRRSEICALNGSDIDGNIVKINKDKVMGPDNLWHIKQPKTYSGYREIEFPDFVIQRIPKSDGPIITVTPNTISGQFKRAIRKAGLPHFRFHDLRHYSASIMHAIGVPDQYIVQRGGWSTDHVMKSIYRSAIDTETVKQNRKINRHFKKMM